MDAVRELIGYKLMREIIGFLRIMLNHILEPLPVLEAETQTAVSDHLDPIAATDQLRADGEHSADQPIPPAEPSVAFDSVPYEQPVEIEEEVPSEATEFVESAPVEDQDGGTVEAHEDIPVSPPRKGRGRR